MDADCRVRDENARMTPVAQVLAALEALTLITVGVLESFFYRTPSGGASRVPAWKRAVALEPEGAGVIAVRSPLAR